MSKFYVTATWDDVPHLSAAAKAELLASIPPYQRDARTKGIPQLGAGAIFPVPESDILIDDFAIPDYWPRAYGMDVGWNKTAAIWGARNNNTGQIILYSEHYRGQAEPVVHAQAIKSRGDWIPGAIDPAANGRGQLDGKRLLVEYQKLGLKVDKADNAVEAGLYAAWTLLSTGQMKVFKSLKNWLAEFRSFQRDKDGKIIDEAKFHLMACTRYFVMTGREIMKQKPVDREVERRYRVPGTSSGGWMG